MPDIPLGIKASQLITLLAENITKHGDQQVMLTPYDCVEGVDGVLYRKKEAQQFPANCFVIY